MDTSGLAGKANVLEEYASSGAVTPNFVTPMQSHSSCSDHSDAGAASRSPFYSARIEGLSELRSKFDNQLEFEVESSKSHWTEVSAATADSDDSDVQLPNSVVFEMMKEHPVWGPLFRRQILFLEIGAKIAEGGQAEIFEALGMPPSSLHVLESRRKSLVLKVFKKGYCLDDLQRSWPPALASHQSLAIQMFDRNADSKGGYYSVGGVDGLCLAVGVHLMDDGRFAFIFNREWGDLRKLIDENMLERNGCPPFDAYTTYKFIEEIAIGMFNLHKLGILHNDLKAANVLVSEDMFTRVGDFESSVAIAGTGFWRAPEILLALKNGNLNSKTFTEKTDVYSFAMTCYEIITGQLPFGDHDKRDYDIILRGERPTLPNNLPSMLKNLVRRCWHQDPLKRPSFVRIVEGLNAIERAYF